MLDHYYTPRDPLPAEQMTVLSGGILAEYSPGSAAVGEKPKPLAPRTVVDLTSLNLEQIPFAFDCDSDEDDSGSDDGYVSTLLRLQKSLPVVTGPRKIAGARRVARAVSSPIVPGITTAKMEMPVEMAQTPREIFQSITAIPGLETTSFEELRLETYLQSLIATGCARPQPAFTPAMAIPPTFSPQFCDWDKESASTDAEMPNSDTPAPASSSTLSFPGPSSLTPGHGHPPFVLRSVSFPPSNGDMTWN
ncbi:hypothetical protein C8F01DRAFT_1362213 [Mycena amicta]|nr:hypothetical protein C8F01DRAFT_1362213 [Mycena amicta]